MVSQGYIHPHNLPYLLICYLTFQLLRGWVYILPIIVFSLLYNVPKFAEVRPCQVKVSAFMKHLSKKTKKTKNYEEEEINIVFLTSRGQMAVF